MTAAGVDIAYQEFYDAAAQAELEEERAWAIFAEIEMAHLWSRD